MILIIDGNNLAHRCRHTFDLSYKGVDVSVTYGVIRTLYSYLRKFMPDSVIVCWDGGIPEFRRQILPSYKANRSHADDEDYSDFVRQLKELSDTLPLMGMVCVRKGGVEADDLMYHASRLADEGSVIVTSDADLYQAICAGTSVYSPTKDKVLEQESIARELGFDVYESNFNPASFVYLKALSGDSSDNVPGIPGIGMKTAIKLFQQYGSLSGIVNAALGTNPAGTIGGKTGERIVEFGIERLAKNVAVMTLHRDEIGARKAVVDAVCGHAPANKNTVKQYFMAHAFTSLMEPELYASISKLRKPRLCTSGVRMPVACQYRRSV